MKRWKPLFAVGAGCLFAVLLHWHGTPVWNDSVVVLSTVEPGSIPAEQRGVSECRATTLIDHLGLDPCYAPQNRALLRKCNCRSSLEIANQITYRIKNPEDDAPALSPEEIKDQLLLVFIHANKAGGSTIKKDIIFPTLQANQWDGASFGTFKGWQHLGTPWPQPHNSGEQKEHNVHKEQSFFHDEPLYVKCGKHLGSNAVKNKSLKSIHDNGGCPLRAVWGSMSMGLCDHFARQPCFYLTVLRDPVSRAVSNYNYVCVQGAEGRKKWKPEWKERGECPLNITEFFEAGLGEPDFFLWRLTRGCDAQCGAQAAIDNLQHPCMRFLLLEELQDGLTKLQGLLGEPYRESIETLLQRELVANKGVYSQRVKDQLESKEIMEDLRHRLHHDIRIYQAAKARYEAQWSLPLVSCNHLSS